MEYGRLSFASLRQAPDFELERVMRSGRPPDGIAGSDFRGWNTNPITGVLGIRKFIKVFREGPEGLRGHNLVVRQSSGETWEPVMKNGEPQKRGYYRLTSPGARYPNSLLIDYGGQNPGLDPAGLLRDYIVQVEPDVLLGKAYMALGPLYLPVSFFILERIATH